MAEIKKFLTKKSFLRNLRPVALAIGILLCALVLRGLVYLDVRAEDQPLPRLVESKTELPEFEAHLEAIRQILAIPGMSAAVVQDQELVWAAGFGYADLENQVPATPHTPYGLASVTKPVAAVLIMQLVEEGLISLDAPLTDYSVNQLGDNVTVRHLLTHTSEGIPGTKHEYNGSRYGLLGGVIEGATGQTFAENLSKRILLPVGMMDTALNPINNWGGLSLMGIEDLTRMLGWGTAYHHYSDVYTRLAQPYQFDDEFHIISGMYHLYHNPGAGLISSVSDLAKFDIALDQGLLLGDAAKTEMHSPAYSTYQNRTDLNYGLGWYVQDFEGLQLLWHCGRWPPSTSALYLKVPEKNLTFIVLANTDNLTVPFTGIGNGDVTQSTLFLSFFRYFIFPEQYGYNLPSLDWGADQMVLLQQLDGIEDGVVRQLLERELWSYRQAFASSGQAGQAEKLERVSLLAYPVSNFRRNWMFTQTAGSNPVIPPVVRVSFFVWLSWGVILWSVLVFISMIWMGFHCLRTKRLSRGGKTLWLLSTLILGPVAPILVRNLIQPGVKNEQPTVWQRAWYASALSIAGYSLAWFVAMTLVMSLGNEPHPLAILGFTYFLPLLVGLFVVHFPLVYHQVEAKTWRVIPHLLLAEVITLNLGYAVFFPLTMLLSNRLLTQIPSPASPLFAFMVSFIAIVGTLVLTPLQYWMLRNGIRLPLGLTIDTSSNDAQPALRTTWPALLITFVTMVVALIVTIGQLE